MPKAKKGWDKLGIEHEVKPDNPEKGMTEQEVRNKAKHYQGKFQY